MNKIDIVNWMENRREPNGDYSIKNSKKLLEYLGSPQEFINIVHVAGTNGKGSICNYIASVCKNSGIKTGLFISPYIEDINESASINGIKIGDEEFAVLGSRVIEACEKADLDGYYPTYFDILTAISYLYFFENRVDIAIVEVGMGGRLDSTNVMESPLCSVIASISLDHTNFLGDTVAKIAYEKAGIIKEARPVFSYIQADEAVEVLENEAREKHTFVVFLDSKNIKDIVLHEGGSSFSYKNYKNIEISLAGVHQVYNAALALDVIDFLKIHYKIDDKSIFCGMKKAQNHARCETISTSPHVILDGSHNLEGIMALKNYIKTLSYNRLILGFSILEDKDYKYITSELIPMADEIIITEIKNERKLDIDELYDIVKINTKSSVIKIKDNMEAFEKSIEESHEGDLIIWCGSLYLMKEIREGAIEYLKNM